nr:MAG TPA: hypothetical protein [Caudoviricetes sp.]
MYFMRTSFHFFTTCLQSSFHYGFSIMPINKT